MSVRRGEAVFYFMNRDIFFEFVFRACKTAEFSGKNDSTSGRLDDGTLREFRTWLLSSGRPIVMSWGYALPGSLPMAMVIVTVFDASFLSVTVSVVEVFGYPAGTVMVAELPEESNVVLPECE